MDEYVLDFVIPAGETGPNPPLCYIDYNTTTNAKRLSIKGTKIFHSNNDFTVNADNSLTIIPGTYEITFCGKIECNGNFQRDITVSLHEILGGGISQPVEGMSIVLSPGMSYIHFSETRILTFPDPEDIFVLISNNNTEPVTVSMGSLILRKIS